VIQPVIWLALLDGMLVQTNSCPPATIIVSGNSTAGALNRLTLGACKAAPRRTLGLAQSVLR